VLGREFVEAKELLVSRKNRKKGKRVAIHGKFAFSTQEVLEIARQAEEHATTKPGWRGRALQLLIWKSVAMRMKCLRSCVVILSLTALWWQAAEQ
jgi:hypothetical protein